MDDRESQRDYESRYEVTEELELQQVGESTEIAPETEECTVEELLISCVEARPGLWDSRLPLKERSKTIRDQLWLEIFREFGENPNFSVDFLIKRWRGLRDTYIRLKGEYTPSGSSAKKKKKWEYFDSMQFLNNTISYRPTVSNVVPPPTPSASDLACASPLVSPSYSEKSEPRSKKKNNIEEAILGALDKVNSTPLPSLELQRPAEQRINPICLRISEILNMMPQNPRTLLEIELLKLAFEKGQQYLE